MDQLSNSTDLLSEMLESVELVDETQEPVIVDQYPLKVNSPAILSSINESSITPPAAPHCSVETSEKLDPSISALEPRRGIRQHGGYFIHSMTSLAYNMGRRTYANILDIHRPNALRHKFRDNVNWKLETNYKPSSLAFEPVVSIDDCNDDSSFTNISLRKLTYAEAASRNNGPSITKGNPDKPKLMTECYKLPDTANSVENETLPSASNSSVDYMADLEGFEYDVEEYYHKKLPGTRKKSTLKNINSKF